MRIAWFLLCCACSAKSVQSNPSCAEGETQRCLGPGACEGAQACLSNGSGWSECNCGSSGGATATGGSPGSGGGAVSTGGTSPLTTGGTNATIVGGSTALGGSSHLGGAPSGGTTANSGCTSLSPSYEDGGLLLRTGATDPSKSVALGANGYYVMPTNTYHGYCFTFADNVSPNGSTVFPPCGVAGPCFSPGSGLCLAAHLGANSTQVYGGAIACHLNQAQVTGAAAGYVGVSGRSSLSVAAYGCKVPSQLQVQLNVVNPPMDSTGAYGDGYYCALVALSAPDTNGMQTATIPLSSLRQDCWQVGGPSFDPATLLVQTIELQINALSTASDWDFCVSSLSID